MKIYSENNQTLRSESAGLGADRFAVVLAGGDGTRLKSLTRAIAGDERPKQFCRILGDDSLLDQTVSRIKRRIKDQNIFYSLTASHSRFYEPLLRGVSETRRVIQPINRGTAPAILYSLLRVEETNPEANVAMFPSDHYISDAEAFMGCVDNAFDAVDDRSDSIVLLGISPEKPETSYGWIEPGRNISGLGLTTGYTSTVKRFWEKPSREAATFLMNRGCLWNSFVMIGKVRTFLSMIDDQLPDLYEMFRRASGAIDNLPQESMIESLYESLSEINFSTEVLQNSSSYLEVMRVGNIGWSDWGEPNRVLGTLHTLGVSADWMASVTV